MNSSLSSCMPHKSGKNFSDRFSIILKVDFRSRAFFEFITVVSKDIPSEGKAKDLLFRRDFFLLFGTVVYNIWTKRVGDLDYESINFCSKVRYTIVTAAAHLRKGAGAAAGRTLKIEYAASGTSR